MVVYCSNKEGLVLSLEGSVKCDYQLYVVFPNVSDGGTKHENPVTDSPIALEKGLAL